MSGELGNNELDLPYEDGPPGQSITDNFEISGGLVVLASVVPVPGVGPMPGLIFRFAAPEGKFYAPRLLVLDDGQMLKIGELILKASAAARREAKAQQR